MTTDATVEAALGELHASAPPSLAPRTLTEVGLADWYTRMPSPIGELVVAWNGLGVATVEAAADDTAFETAHRARTGRVAYRADHLPDRLANAITRRLEGERRVRIDLDLRGHTEFEKLCQRHRIVGEWRALHVELSEELVLHARYAGLQEPISPQPERSHGAPKRSSLRRGNPGGALFESEPKRS